MYFTNEQKKRPPFITQNLHINSDKKFQAFVGWVERDIYMVNLF